MAKISQAIKLTKAQISQLLAEEKYVRIATIGPGTDINLTPMTFGWAGGKIYIFARGQKVANLRRNSTTTLLLDVGDEWRELKGIMLRGKAVVLEDSGAELADPDLAEAQLNLGKKHNLNRDGKPAAYSASASGNSRRWIVFLAEHIVSWDNEKLS